MSSRRPVSPRAGRPARERAGSAPQGGPARPGGSAPPPGRAGGSGARPAGGTRPGPGRAPGGRSPGERGGAGRRRRVLRWGAERGDGAPRPTVSLRALGLFLVALVAFVVLAPTLRYAVTQQEDLRTLNADVAAAEERTAQLEDALERWQDPAYVQAQARDRLGYVAPGETPYVVIDPETVVGEEAETARQEALNPLPDVTTPWYLAVWDSVEVAGRSPAHAEDELGGQGTGP